VEESIAVLALTHGRSTRIFAAQVLIQCRLEFGDPGRGDVPDLVEIHPDVIVDQDVAYAADCFFWNRASELNDSRSWRQQSVSFASVSFQGFSPTDEIAARVTESL